MSKQSATKLEEEDEGSSGHIVATQLPIRLMTAIFFCQMNEATQITMPYTIAVFMVRDFLGPEASQAQISRLTGILAACFCAAQFVTSIPLGYLSDTYGRKRIVIMSNISSLVSVLGFGMSTTYLAAFFTRLSGGFCNFTFGCLKAMIGESMDLPTQAHAMGYLSLAWGLGTILGPSLGGALAMPCTAYGDGFPLCGSGQLFRTRPFLLPCLAAAFISFMALMSSLFLLKETLPSKTAAKYARLQQLDEEQGSAWPQKQAPSAPEGVELSQAVSHERRKVVRGDSAEELSWHRPNSPKLHAAPVDNLAPQAGTVGIEVVNEACIHQAITEHNSAEPAAAELQMAASDGAESAAPEMSSIELRSMHEAETSNQSSSALPRQADGDPLQDRNADGASDQQQQNDDETAILIASSEDNEAETWQQSSQRAGASREADRTWYKERPVQLTIAGYTSIAFLYNCSDELTPLFAAAPASIGGVGLTASQLAVPLIFSGLVMMWYAVYGYPPFQKKYGAVAGCRIGLLATAPFVLLIPTAHFASSSVIAAQVVLCIVLGFKGMAATNSFSASMILVNNAAPKHALGKVNGTGQMLASFVRAVGPALAGIVWGSTTQLGISGSQFISFAAVAVLAGLTQFMYVFLKMPEGA